MDYNTFITGWIKRAERKERDDQIDMGDKFISLWIAFNAWLKKEFGEATRDHELLDKVIGFEPMENAFKNLKIENSEFQKTLLILKNYSIIDMRYPEDKSKQKNYNGSFESLMESFYMIRCNLFHGRKNFEDNEKDKKLVFLAYRILLPLFKKYLNNQ